MKEDNNKEAERVTLQECKDEVARKYQLHVGQYYTDWQQMEAWLISLSGENSRELFRRKQEAEQLFKSQPICTETDNTPLPEDFWRRLYDFVRKAPRADDAIEGEKNMILNVASKALTPESDKPETEEWTSCSLYKSITPS